MDKDHIIRIYYYPDGSKGSKILFQEATAEYYKKMGSDLNKFKKGKKFNILDDKLKKAVMVIVNEVVEKKGITELHVKPTINLKVF